MRISPRMRRDSTPAELPVVGDWVGLDADGIVHSVLPRRTAVSRRAPRASATEAAREQVIAANVDVIFVVAPFDRPSTAASSNAMWHSRCRVGRARSSC